MELIDLSREIFHRTQTHPSHPPVVMTVWGDHSEKKIAGNTVFTSKAMYLSMSDHAGTHVDAPVHFDPRPGAASIDEVPLEDFYTSAICLDLSHIPLKHAATVAEMEAALAKSGQEIRPGDTVLLHMGTNDRLLGKPGYLHDFPGSGAGIRALAGGSRDQDVRGGGDQPGPGGRAEFPRPHGLRGARDHPHRMPGEPRQAGRARALPVHRLSAEDPRRDRQPDPCRGGVRIMLRTRLTEFLGIAHPILSAPMAFAAGGKLAAAVSAAGGLGLIGGGYGDPEWVEREFASAGNARIGCGFIGWSIADRPEVLARALAHAPAAVMTSFADPAPFAAAIKAAGSKLICQVQTMDHTRAALDAGADIVIAQGTEAGGHGGNRATFTLVPEVADLLAARSPQTLLMAAGGVADGRGLAAALMLGADGVLVGSRFWASAEAAVHANHHRAAVAATGDGTIRQRATDIARRYSWPAEFTGRVLKNAFTQRWHGREDELRAQVDAVSPAYMAGVAAGDPDNVGVWVGEATGMIHAIVPAGEIVTGMVAQAEALLTQRAAGLVA